LEVLEEAELNLFEHVITGDESWFFLDYQRDSLRAESRDAVPERSKQKIDTEKCLIFVLWCVTGIHTLIDVLNGMMENADFFCHAVMSSLIADVKTDSRRKTLKGLVIHLDSARPHNSRRSQECIAESKAQH
jgi:hypothetical protein